MKRIAEFLALVRASAYAVSSQLIGLDQFAYEIWRNCGFASMGMNMNLSRCPYGVSQEPKAKSPAWCGALGAFKAR